MEQFLKEITDCLQQKIKELDEDLSAGQQEIMNITGEIIRKWMSMAMKIMTISRRYSIRFMQMKKSFQRERGLQRCWSLRFLEE